MENNRNSGRVQSLFHTTVLKWPVSVGVSLS